MAVAAISPAAMVARISLVFIFFIPALIFLPILGLQARSWQSRGGQAMNRRFILLALLAAILVAGAVLVLAPGSKQATEAPPLAGATLGGPFSLVDQDGRRSEERRVGQECVGTCSSRGWPSHSKKKEKN